MKHVDCWYSPRLQKDMHIVRWGHYGRPLLLFPTAGGDPEEVERFHLVNRLQPFIDEGRLKVYSIDSLNGRVWMTDPSIAHRVWVHKQFDEYVRQEVVPWIFHDCRTDFIEVFAAGASIGALNALSSVCRHPDIFRAAICISGTYDIQRWLEGQWIDDFYFVSPLQFVPGLSGHHLDQLRNCFVILATGQGRWEAPGESWKVARVLGQQGIPNRVDLWDHSWDHDWETWRHMLPQYVGELL
jgi:esterase/lipase superfamily enzyme